MPVVRFADWSHLRPLFGDLLPRLQSPTALLCAQTRTKPEMIFEGQGVDPASFCWVGAGRQASGEDPYVFFARGDEQLSHRSGPGPCFLGGGDPAWSCPLLSCLSALPACGSEWELMFAGSGPS